MKNIYLIVIIIILIGLQLPAQQVGSAFLDVNNVKARFNSNGVNFWDLQGSAQYFVPANSTQTSFFSQSLWLAGKDSLGHDRYAADLYGVGGFFCTSGPISNNYDSIYDLQWNRIFVIYRSAIDSFLNWFANPSSFPGYQIPNEILHWPAHGDVSKGQAYYLAPFKDVNNDGVYNPSMGDYPLMKGDKALWYVYNDDRQTQLGLTNIKIGAEIQVMAYAYNCNEVFDNTIFIDYSIYKRSPGNLTDCKLGIYADFDLGYFNDDYLGCDVKRGSFYCYNGDNIDDIGFPSSYGINPPAIGISVLNGPYMDPDGIDNPNFILDSLGNPIPACDNSINGRNFGDGIIDNEKIGLTGFSSFVNNTNPPGSFPDTNFHILNLLNNRWGNGSRIFYGATGDSLKGAYGPACTFMYPGLTDPCNWGLGGLPPNGPQVWTEETAANPPGDRRGFGFLGPFIILGNNQQFEPVRLELAFVWARDSINRSLPVLMSAIDTVRFYSQNNMTPCGGTFLDLPKNSDNSSVLGIEFYPNPAQNQTNIIFSQAFSGQIELFDLTGKRIYFFDLQNSFSFNLNLSQVEQGLYFVRISGDSFSKVKKLVKN